MGVDHGCLPCFDQRLGSFFCLCEGWLHQIFCWYIGTRVDGERCLEKYGPLCPNPRDRTEVHGGLAMSALRSHHRKHRPPGAAVHRARVYTFECRCLLLVSGKLRAVTNDGTRCVFVVFLYFVNKNSHTLAPYTTPLLPASTVATLAVTVVVMLHRNPIYFHQKIFHRCWVESFRQQWVCKARRRIKRR